MKPQVQKIIVEEQAGFRAGRSTTAQIFGLRILYEKYLQHQQDLYHVFIDFKKAFDRVWHAALWATMIMSDALEDHEGTVGIRGRLITNLCFAVDIEGLAGEEELAKLVVRLD